MSGGECQTKNKQSYDNPEDEKPIVALDEGLFCVTLSLINWLIDHDFNQLYYVHNVYNDIHVTYDRWYSFIEDIWYRSIY